MSGGLFGAKPVDAAATATTSAPPAAGGLFGANIFGKKDAATATAGTSVVDTNKPAAPPAFSGFSLGGNKDAVKDTTPGASIRLSLDNYKPMPSTQLRLLEVVYLARLVRPTRLKRKMRVQQVRLDGVTS
jgi:hypothetical protein